MREVHKNTLGERLFLHVVVAAWVFVLTLTLLNATGFVPYYIDSTPSKAEAEAVAQRAQEQKAKAAEEKLRAEATQTAVQVLPMRLEIPIAGTSLPVSNPNTTDIDELDAELLTAVVRYPGSGTLGADGNMLIFGHSSGYRTVNNKMFQAFNPLKTLEIGNVIKLISGDTEYIYTVSNLQHEEASNVTIEFGTDPGVKRLTLTTCDSFGKKSDRWIITADFIGSYKTGE